MDSFYKGFLDKETYKNLKLKGVFSSISYRKNKANKDIEQYLHHSVAVFSAVMGLSIRLCKRMSYRIIEMINKLLEK